MSDTWRDYMVTRPAPLDRVEVALLLAEHNQLPLWSDDEDGDE
jgi:hypothetical protein